MNNQLQAAPASAEKSRAARASLDGWVREIVDWHFNPETGCPFWLDHAKKLDWDPRTEVRGFADLNRFEPFQDEWLRGGPVSRWVPKGYAGRPLFVFDTDGSIGVPKSRIEIEDFRLDYSAFSETLLDESFPRGSDWISIGATGPRRLRLGVEHLAQGRGGICFLLDLDPRWVATSVKRGWTELAETYKAHVIDQALTIVKAHPNVKCLFATPKLLEALCEKISLRQAGITGVVCGGTETTAEFHRHAREELLDGVEFVPTYGSSLMGLACHKPFVPEDEYRIIYHAPQPRAVIEVVASDDPGRVVGYGERGRVKVTTLTKECFVAGFLERDEGIRTPPIELYPWDGIEDVRPL